MVHIKQINKKMHSSRMRTACSLTIFPGLLYGGVGSISDYGRKYFTVGRGVTREVTPPNPTRHLPPQQTRWPIQLCISAHTPIHHPQILPGIYHPNKQGDLSNYAFQLTPPFTTPKSYQAFTTPTNKVTYPIMHFSSHPHSPPPNPTRHLPPQQTRWPIQQ